MVLWQLLDLEEGRSLRVFPQGTRLMPLLNLEMMKVETVHMVRSGLSKSKRDFQFIEMLKTGIHN